MRVKYKIIKFFLITIVLFICTTISGNKMQTVNSNNYVLTLAVPGTWGILTPPEQSSHYAEIILANTFETLVQLDANGNIVPVLAKSWAVSEDLKRITFYLDINRQFSNGVKLTAQIYKKSLEQSLAIAPAGANISSQDVLYRIEGYEKFHDTQTLTGLIAESDEKLTMIFKEPFRKALSELTGVRFATFIKSENEQFLGTGPYILESYDEKIAKLKINPFWKGKIDFADIKIYALGDGLLDSFEKSQFDIYYFGSFVPSDYQWNNSKKKFGFCSGAFLSHAHADINGLPGRIFSTSRHRQALEYLFYKHVLPAISEYYGKRFFQEDIQFFQELQYGRLDESLVAEILDQGQPFVKDLINESKIRPIQIYGVNSEILSVVVEQMIMLGLQVEAHKISFSESQLKYYKTFDFDIRIGGSATGGGDPDNFYHKLGENGAISSPAIGRKSVWYYFEMGRSMMNHEEIHDNYKNANKSILTEVPVIHFGFLRSVFAYDSQLVALDKKSQNRAIINMIDFKLNRKK